MKISITAKVDPETFAKTSNTSACLEAVNNYCAISIPIPKNTENRNETTMDFI